MNSIFIKDTDIKIPMKHKESWWLIFPKFEHYDESADISVGLILWLRDGDEITVLLIIPIKMSWWDFLVVFIFTQCIHHFTQCIHDTFDLSCLWGGIWLHDECKHEQNQAILDFSEAILAFLWKWIR